MLDGKAVGEAILDILRTRYTSGNIIAVDGKAICSTGKSGNPHSALQILSAYLTESGVVLAQETIHEKSNEIPAFQQMLTYLDVQGKTVTADAMHCQRRTSEAIVARKGNYVFGLKENVVAHHFRPVDVGIHYRVGTCPICLDCFTREES